MGTIVCIGGLTNIKSKDNVFLPYKLTRIDYKIISLSKKSKPQILFIGTASNEREDYYFTFKKAFEDVGAIVTNLNIINEDISRKEIKDKILNSDIIYVGCGKTKFMLDIWKKRGVDKALCDAYKKDIILAGMSEGSYCWFKFNYELISGLNLIDMINCVHYNIKTEEQKKQFYKNIKATGLSGVALDDNTAIIFNDKTYNVVKNEKSAKVYIINFNGNEYEKIEINEEFC